MDTFYKAISVMKDLFGKDYQFALATEKDHIPSVRFVDTFYDQNYFYVVTYSKSQKVQEIENNSNVSLCNQLVRFSGKAYNIGHPLLTENQAIRKQLIKAFEPWYFEHNNENDENMCYIKIEIKEGFFYKDGTGYQVDFQMKKAKQFPFQFNMIPVS